MPDHRRRATPRRLALGALLSLAACASPTPPLPTPEGLQAVAGRGQQVRLTWTALADPALDHYALFHRVGAGSQVPLALVPATATAFLASRLAADPAHAFSIAAIDAAGRASAPSAEVTAAVPAAAQVAVPIGTDGAPNGYYEYLPSGSGDGRPRPLIVFWHGIGENGDGLFQLDAVLAHGPPKLIALGQWPADRAALVLSPQNGSGCPSAAQIHAFLTFASGRYDVDPRQVFLTGLSCGASGIWDYLGSYTGSEVAAVVLIAGRPGTAWSRAGCGLGQVALWAFHGSLDPTVNPAPEAAVMADLAACPAPPRLEVDYTVVPGGGHDVWTAVYAGATAGDVFAWLLAHPRP